MIAAAACSPTRSDRLSIGSLRRPVEGLLVDDEPVQLRVGLDEREVGVDGGGDHLARVAAAVLDRGAQLGQQLRRRPGCRPRRRARPGRRSAGRRRSCWCRPRPRSRPCPTPAPCLATAARVASTSCSRRSRRCSSHRESRRSRAGTVADSRRLAVVSDLGPATSSHRLGYSCERQYRVPSVPANRSTDPGGSDGSPDSQGRDRRREPDPVRPLQLDVRAGVQPGHAHRDARRARRPLRSAGQAAGRGRRRRRPQALAATST